MVFPMYVGVIPKLTFVDGKPTCIPHVRGGDPTFFKSLVKIAEYSPCM